MRDCSYAGGLAVDPEGHVMAKHSPHIIKGAPYIPFELYEEHLARKDAALGMAVEALEFMLDKEVTCPQEARRRVAAAALAACRAELEGK